MSAVSLELRIKQGEDLVVPLTWKSAPLDSNGNILKDQATPYNLTGYTAFAAIADKNFLLLTPTFSLDNGIVLGGVAGTITWTITSAKSKLWIPARYSYDLWVVSGAGLHYPIIQGAFWVERSYVPF